MRTNALHQFAVRLDGEVNHEDVQAILLTIGLDQHLPEFVREAALNTRYSMREEVPGDDQDLCLR
jgi:hypothetical protein